MTQQSGRAYLFPVLLAGSAVLVLFWAYATTLAEIAWYWANDPRYSHGYLVPAFAVALLYFRRKQIDLKKLQPSTLGLVLLGVAAAVRLGGSYYHFLWLDQISLIGSVA